VLSFLTLAKETYGYNNGKNGFLLTSPVKNPNHQLPPVEHQFQVLDMLDIKYKKDILLELWPSKNDHRRVQELLESEWLANYSQIIGINVAASEKWKTKNWPVEHMARLCDLLASQNKRVILTGIEKDKELAQRLMSLTKTKPANFVGKTNVMELAVLIKHCQVFVTPDSAPMHIAAAMKVPFVALFGPTSSIRHLPPATSCHVFEKKPPCAPCYSAQCKVKTHICMLAIAPEDVVKKINELIEVRNI
ncbi:MAG: glycosyltransferase family 9 protein, partial [Candidatus Omnitrophica bacterium]|nr:glycosyltransferase family 9 protein [Candidatus Omnitrophota bacterium]